jgi:hypothetical protein
MYLKAVTMGLALTTCSAGLAQTTEVSPSVFRVESGVMFELNNAGASDFLFNWTDSSGTVVDEADPTLILTAGETYIFRRLSGSHPFVITDDTLPVSGTDGSYSRTTFDGAVIDGATLDPIPDFTADPGPTTDLIMWTPSPGDIGEYFYTCRVTGHPGMTGRIEIVAPAGIDEEDIQFKSVDFENGIVELHNYGGNDQDLTGWRTCTHDFDEQRQYSAPGGLNGVMIESGTSIFLHFNSDAPADPDRHNISSIGGTFALPLDQDAYGFQIYHPDENGSVSFGNAELIADHVQWNIDGEGVGAAEARTAQVVSVGLWTAVGDFVATSSDSLSFDLTDFGDGRLHGPSNYSVTNPCIPDFTGEGQLNFLDVSAFLSAFGNQDPIADLTNDTNFNFLDVSLFLQLFGQGCP